MIIEPIPTPPDGWDYYPNPITVSELFIKIFNWIADDAHAQANEKGFWPVGADRNDGEIIANIHAEVSEAFEAVLGGNPPDDKIPNFTSLEAELADVVIRVMDYAAARGLRVGEAIVEKMKYNETRPYRHGKEF